MRKGLGVSSSVQSSSRCTKPLGRAPRLIEVMVRLTPNTNPSCHIEIDDVSEKEQFAPEKEKISPKKLKKQKHMAWE